MKVQVGTTCILSVDSPSSRVEAGEGVAKGLAVALSRPPGVPGSSSGGGVPLSTTRIKRIEVRA